MSRPLRTVFLTTAILSLAACGGGDATLGGTVSGLATGTSVTVQNNGASDLALTANGGFTFAGSISSGSTYNVTVLTQPVGGSCSVTNASGTIDSAGSNVSSVIVTCVPNSSIAGTVTGLAAGTSVTLSNSGVILPIAANGVFAFPGVLAAGTAYSVIVSTQPVGQTCTVANGTGTVVANTQTAITVTCI